MEVSIRAPRSSAGRPFVERDCPIPSKFQSAPRVLLRGDASNRGARRGLGRSFNPRPAFFCGATISPTNSAIYYTFQSAPRVLLRGDGVVKEQRLVRVEVSIRAPRSSAGRPGRPGRLPHCYGGFNPRPAFFCGATLWRARLPDPQQVSIRAPRSSAGRRLKPGCKAGPRAEFQSAPPVLLRGDHLANKFGHLFHVSIRAPRSSAGRRSGKRTTACTSRSFNPRPAFFCGATLSRRTPYATWCCFNPRPAFFCGATRTPRPLTSLLWRFQSAPRVLLRGDGAPCAQTKALSSFNPRPAFFCGATAMRWKDCLRQWEFQSAPRVLLRGDQPFPSTVWERLG